jgi:hypothetical protein
MVLTPVYNRFDVPETQSVGVPETRHVPFTTHRSQRPSLPHRLVSRLPLSPAVAGLALAGLVAFLLAFALAGATASDDRSASPGVRPLRTSGTALSLPRLSQAAPLPVLARTVRAATPARVRAAPPHTKPVQTEPVQTQPVQTQPVQATPVRNKPVRKRPVRKKPKPVVIVGSG